MNKTIPLEILQLPKHKLKIFLDGYMSGDGCNIKHTSIYQATTISRELAESLVLVIQKVYNVGCRIYYTKRPKKCIIEGREVNQNDTYMVRFNLNLKKPLYLVDNNCIWYPIKKISNTNTIQTIYNTDTKFSFSKNTFHYTILDRVYGDIKNEFYDSPLFLKGKITATFCCRYFIIGALAKNNPPVEQGVNKKYFSISKKKPPVLN